MTSQVARLPGEEWTGGEEAGAVGAGGLAPRSFFTPQSSVGFSQSRGVLGC